MTEYRGLQSQWAELERQEREAAMLEKIKSIIESVEYDDDPWWVIGVNVVLGAVLWVFAFIGAWTVIGWILG